MEVEWLSALAVVALLVVFLWRTGASAQLTLLIVVLAVTAIVGTALTWELLIGSDS